MLKKVDLCYHSELNSMRWENVRGDDLVDRYNFPQLTKHTFHQMYELVGIHAIRKSQGTASHMRSMEVNATEDPQNMDELEELLGTRLENPRLQVCRLDNEPGGYQELVDDDVLPPWPGPGYLFRIVCAPAMRSDTDKSAYKKPTLYLLDSDVVNPLNCTDKFKRIAGLHCYNCPSTAGTVGSCCHLACLLSICSADFLLDLSVNRCLSLVNMKNPYHFQHPEENMDFACSAPIPVNVPRTSKDKRSNDPFYDGSKFGDLVDMEGNIIEDTIDDNRNDCNGVHDDNADNQEDNVADPEELIVDETIDNIEMPGSQIQEADVRSVASSAPSSYYGRGVANVERYIIRKVAADVRLRIPPVNENRGKLILFLFQFHLICHSIFFLLKFIIS